MPKKGKRIGISGKARTGKDTLTKILLRYLPTFRRVALADGIRQELSKASGLSETTLEKHKVTHPTTRTALIYIGEFRKQDKPTYWVDRLPENEDIIVPDIRFNLEVDSLLPDILLTRLEAPREQRILRGKLSNENHYSECELDNYPNWDYVIMNDSNEADLEKKVKKFIKEVSL